MSKYSAYQNLQLPHSPLVQGNQPSGQVVQQQNIDHVLNQLADIHLPPKVEFWPPALGWWIATFLLIIVLFFSIKMTARWLKNRRLKSQIKKQIANEIQLIQNHWQKHDNIILTAAKLSTLLRRYALLGFSREEIAAISDYDLLQLIEKNLHLTNFTKQYQALLHELPYQDPSICFATEEKQQLQSSIEQLIKLLRKLANNRKFYQYYFKNRDLSHV